MPTSPSTPQIWLLDACCALNLAASGHLEAILRTPVSGAVRQFMMAETVLGEAASLRRGGSGDDAEARDPFDWEIHFTSGLVGRTEPQDQQEMAHFVAFSQDPALNDGEAMCLALATVRAWGVVTDDIPAQKRMGGVPFLATPDLLKNWADAEAVDAATLAAALRQINEKARYTPPRHHSLRTWWLNTLNVG